MQSAVLTGTLSFLFAIVVTFGVGMRLLLVAWRTREAPETAIGLAMIMIGMGALADAAASVVGTSSHPVFWQAAELLFYCLGVGVLYVGVWWLFRRHSGWARMLAIGGALSLLAGFSVVMVAGGHSTAEGTVRPGLAAWGYYLSLMGRIGGYTWIAIESIRYYFQQRRGIEYGFADPLITHQFLLWGISTVALAVTVSAALLWRLLSGESLLASAAGLYLLSACGLVANLSIWLAFFPPRHYASWVVGDTAPAGS